MEVDADNVTTEQVFDLMKQKDNLEKEVLALQEVLSSNKVGMNEALVDAEGFPRNDIDVYQVRHARHNIIVKTNDLKQMMSRIESGLHNLHSQAREGIGKPLADRVADMEVSEEGREPFCRVIAVVEGSPAAEAGIQQNDLLLQFGTVNADNFRSLTDISRLVESSRDRPVSVLVSRAGQPVRTRLTPRVWSGQGLLGFKIRPLDTGVDR